MKRIYYKKIMNALMLISVSITCALTIFMFAYVLYRGVPNLSWELISGEPSYINESIGILPDILNTVYVIIGALVIVLPLGTGAAIYLTEYASNRKIVGIIEYAQKHFRVFHQ